jgi:hypothetical protein
VSSTHWALEEVDGLYPTVSAIPCGDLPDGLNLYILFKGYKIN